MGVGIIKDKEYIKVAEGPEINIGDKSKPSMFSFYKEWTGVSAGTDYPFTIPDMPAGVFIVLKTDVKIAHMYGFNTGVIRIHTPYNDGFETFWGVINTQAQ